MRGGPYSFHPRTNTSIKKGIGLIWYRYQWKGQTNLNVEIAVLTSPFLTVSAVVDAAVASCASPNAENPTAKTDRVSSAMTNMTAILAFIIWPAALLRTNLSTSLNSILSSHLLPPQGNRQPQHLRLHGGDECSVARRARISGSKCAGHWMNAIP